MSDKVRYYLEQSVPELEDLLKRKIFDKKEINQIMRKRTSFEHRIQGRGSKPNDFLKYIEFENNLEELRKKRISRLKKTPNSGIILKKSISDWSGPRRIFFIFERSIKKYSGDLEIWRNYLNYCKKNSSVKKTYNVYSKLLKLHPRKIEFWISAANFEIVDNSNIQGGRILLQRGLRFNEESLKLWLEYAKLELIFVSKLLVRRRILGLLTESQQKAQLEKEQQVQNEKLQEDDKFNIDEEEVSGFIDTPIIDDDELKSELKTLPDVDINMLGDVESNPALKGDVALAVFDSALPVLIKYKHELNPHKSLSEITLNIATSFLELFDSFKELNRGYLCQHIIEYLTATIPNNGHVLFLHVTLPLRHVEISSSSFPDALKLVINNYNGYFVLKSKFKNQSESDEYKSLENMSQELTIYFNKILEESSLDSNIEIVIKSLLKKCKTFN